jgi:hypothetical protein
MGFLFINTSYVCARPMRDFINKQRMFIMTTSTAITVKTASSGQVGGTHYVSKAIQPWDFIVANDLSYLEGNIVKYCSRWRDKAGVQDLEKALHYLDKSIEVETKKRQFKAMNYYRFIGVSPEKYVEANGIGEDEAFIITTVTNWRNLNGIPDLHAARVRLIQLIASLSDRALSS